MNSRNNSDWSRGTKYSYRNNHSYRVNIISHCVRIRKNGRNMSRNSYPHLAKIPAIAGIF